jgi:GxxExxY protein
LRFIDWVLDCSSHKACLAHELAKRGLAVEQEKGVALVYDDVKLECGYRMDVLVEHSIVVEVKSVDCWRRFMRLKCFPI